MLTAGELRRVLREAGLRLTRRLGQHHLIDPAIAGRIVEACRLSGRETVVEIGAGLGALTEALAERAARVTALEVDAGIAALLARRLAHRSNVAVLHQDVLRFPWEEAGPAIAVGTIPYHITSQILVNLAEHRRAIPNAVLVVQREVALRLTAKPNTRAYGRLSVLGQYRWRIETVMAVPRSAFFPQPGVDSVCLALAAKEPAGLAGEDEPRFFSLVKVAFAQRRKTLVNCLGSDSPLRMSRAEAEGLLRSQGLPVSVRGEALSLAQFAQLSNALRERRRRLRAD